jgi:hypothetical protein
MCGIVMSVVPGGLKGPQKASFRLKKFFSGDPVSIFLAGYRSPIIQVSSMYIIAQIFYLLGFGEDAGVFQFGGEL